MKAGNRAPAAKWHPRYALWSSMVARCHNPKHPDYPSYGGRGITVCTRWRESIDAFTADMGERPRGATLDRIDNDGGYEPSNCRWASRWEQGQNRRDTRYITWNGETLSVGRWFARFTPCVGYTTYRSRLYGGMAPDVAATTPADPRFNPRRSA